MDSGEAAQVAALVGAAGAALVLLASSRWPLLAGLALLAGAEVVLVLDLAEHGRRISPGIAALGVAGLAVMAAGAAIFVRYPAAVTPLVLAAAPFRPPLEFGGEHRFYVAAADPGELGRLFPLYAVLGAAALALAWSALRGRKVQRVPLLVALPAIAFVGLAAASLLWTKDLYAGENEMAYFLLPFATLVGVVARAPYPAWMTRALAAIAIALATLFAVVGLVQAVTHELWFFSPSVEVSNAYRSFFRVTSLFRDPSLYGRHVVLGIAVVLVAVLLRRVRPLVAAPLVALLFAGLWFSYSQSSLAALFVVTLALATFVGDYRLRTVAIVVAAMFALGGTGLVVASASGHSLKRITSDRSQLVEQTVDLVRDHPLTGVGLGGHPRASQARSERGGSPARFVSHTTPLTVAAELGLLGTIAYLALLGGAGALIWRVRRLNPALGLGLAATLLALFVHSLFYPGFLEDPVMWFVLAVAASFVLSRTDDDSVIES